MMVQPNLDIAVLSNPRTASIAQAFAKSVLFGFPIKETTATHYVVDLTLLMQIHGVALRLKQQQGYNRPRAFSYFFGEQKISQRTVNLI